MNKSVLPLAVVTAVLLIITGVMQAEARRVTYPPPMGPPQMVMGPGGYVADPYMSPMGPPPMYGHAGAYGPMKCRPEACPPPMCPPPTCGPPPCYSEPSRPPICVSLCQGAFKCFTGLLSCPFKLLACIVAPGTRQPKACGPMPPCPPPQCGPPPCAPPTYGMPAPCGPEPYPIPSCGPHFGPGMPPVGPVGVGPSTTPGFVPFAKKKAHPTTSFVAGEAEGIFGNYW